MKIRSGFVSNSSTSSFLIYGVAVESSKLKELLDERAKSSGAVEEDEDMESDDEHFCLSTILEKICDKVDFEFHFPTDDTWYIGRSWSDIGDDQTGAQFKKEVEEAIDDMLGEGMDCETHSMAWDNH